MKNMRKKSAAAVTTISGVDGPTSVFLLKKPRTLTLRQKLQKKKNGLKRKWIAAHITAGSHSMEEVCEYIKNKYGFTEVGRDKHAYQEEYRQMRYSFMAQYAPQLLGERPELKGESKEEVEEYFEKLDKMQEMAQAIPTSDFDIKLHVYKKQLGDINSNMHISVEENYGYIGGGTCGDKKVLKEFRKIYHDIYRYYGVTKEDIENKSKRYDSLIRTLAIK